MKNMKRVEKSRVDITEESKAKITVEIDGEYKEVLEVKAESLLLMGEMIKKSYKNEQVDYVQLGAWGNPDALKACIIALSRAFSDIDLIIAGLTLIESSKYKNDLTIELSEFLKKQINYAEGIGNPKKPSNAGIGLTDNKKIKSILGILGLFEHTFRQKKNHKRLQEVAEIKKALVDIMKVNDINAKEYITQEDKKFVLETTARMIHLQDKLASIINPNKSEDLANRPPSGTIN